MAQYSVFQCYESVVVRSACAGSLNPYLKGPLFRLLLRLSLKGKFILPHGIFVKNPHSVRFLQSLFKSHS